MRSFDLGCRFDVVTCLFSSVGDLPSTDALDAAIANMAIHTDESGVVIFEPWHHDNIWPTDHRYHELVLTDTGTVERLLEVSVIDDASVLNMTYAVTSQGLTTVFTEEHRLPLFSADDYRVAMRRAGLLVEHDPVGLSGRGLFICRRRYSPRRSHG